MVNWSGQRRYLLGGREIAIAYLFFLSSQTQSLCEGGTFGPRTKNILGHHLDPVSPRNLHREIS